MTGLTRRNMFSTCTYSSNDSRLIGPTAQLFAQGVAIGVLVVISVCCVACGGSMRSTIVSPARAINAECEHRGPPLHFVGFDARRVLGLTVKAAQREAGLQGCQVRVVEENGKGAPFLLLDENGARIDVVVERGEIVRIKGVY
jgi:hypothetical protein